MNFCPFEYPTFEQYYPIAKENAKIGGNSTKKSTLKNQFHSIISMLESTCQTKRVYRGLMKNDPENFAQKIKSNEWYDFGSHWSADKETALTEFGQGIVLEAEFDPKHIDFDFTICENFTYPTESEIYFKSNVEGQLKNVYYMNHVGKMIQKKPKNTHIRLGERE